MAGSVLFPRDLMDRRRRALLAFEAWEAARPPSSVPADVLALLDALRSLMPADLLEPRAQESYDGVRAMHEALSVLGSSP